MTEYSIESGIVAYQQGDKEQAAVIFTALIKEDPTFADAWFWLGRCLDSAEKARYCFERAASLNPYLATRPYIYEDPDDKPRQSRKEKPRPVESPAPRAKTPALAPTQSARPIVPPAVVLPPVESLRQVNPQPLIETPISPVDPVRPVVSEPPHSPFYSVEPPPMQENAGSLPENSSQDPEENPPRRIERVLEMVIIALIIILALATPVFLLIRSGVIDSWIKSAFLPPAAAAATPVIIVTNTFIPSLTSTPTLKPKATLTQTPRSTSTPAVNLEQMLADAEDELSAGDPAKARESLLPLLDQVSDLKDLSRINALIGDAYASEGLYRMSTYYFEQAYAQQGTVENLYKLATVYGVTGQMALALEKYEALAAWPGAEGDEYREIAQMQLEWLREYFGTTTPIQ